VPVLSSTPSTEDEDDGDEYSPSYSTSATKAVVFHSDLRKNILTAPGVVAALDRVNLSDRGAVFVAGAVAQTLGHDLSIMTFSRSLLRRSRMQARKAAASEDQASFSVDAPLLLHWDGKLLPDISGSAEKVDRIAIIVTGEGVE